MEPIKHFPGMYLGNKTKDYEHIKNHLPENVRVVVEPFAGTFAISRMHYYDHNKYSIHINDTSPLIHELTNMIKNNYPKFISIHSKLSEIISKSKRGKGGYRDVVQKITSMDISQSMRDYFIRSFLIRGVIKQPPKYNYKDLHLFLQNTIITKRDYSVILEKYRNDKKAFLFIDPPYIDSDNSGYENFSEDIEKIYSSLSLYLKICNCKVMIVIASSHLDNLFDEYIRTSYTKTYQISNNKTKLLIITNY